MLCLEVEIKGCSMADKSFHVIGLINDDSAKKSFAKLQKLKKQGLDSLVDYVEIVPSLCGLSSVCVSMEAPLDTVTWLEGFFANS